MGKKHASQYANFGWLRSNHSVNRYSYMSYIKKTKSIDNHQIINALLSRGDWIRTSDHTPPRL